MGPGNKDNLHVLTVDMGTLKVGMGFTREAMKVGKKAVKGGLLRFTREAMKVGKGFTSGCGS